jgi:hypothetical protein
VVEVITDAYAQIAYLMSKSFFEKEIWACSKEYLMKEYKGQYSINRMKRLLLFSKSLSQYDL